MKPLFNLGLLLLSASLLPAQVRLEVSLEQDQFVRDESLPVKVRIENRSGQKLQFGEAKNWLTFDLAHIDGSPVERSGEITIADSFELESAEAASRVIDLMPGFDLSQPGRYQVTATLRIPQWDTDVLSKPAIFEIVRGAKVWEENFGVPGTGDPPEARKYALVQAMGSKRLQLYLRITDLSENIVFKMVSLGPMVTFARPEARIDKDSRIHVLLQTGAQMFIYQVLTPDGTVVVRQFHDYSSTRPHLAPDKNGVLGVVGGKRRATSSDIPPAPLVVFTNARPGVIMMPTNYNPNAKSSGKAESKKK